MLIEYFSAAILFVTFAFRVWRRSYTTTVFAVAMSFALCLDKYRSHESGMIVLGLALVAVTIRAILQQKDDCLWRGQHA